jgi:hypothetical protein
MDATTKFKRLADEIDVASLHAPRLASALEGLLEGLRIALRSHPPADVRVADAETEARSALDAYREQSLTGPASR